MPFVLFVIAILVFFIYINPTWTGSIAATKAAITNDDQALAAANAYAAQESQLASARNSINSESLARLSTMLPDSVDNVGLIVDLNALAARSGLSISNIDVVARQAVSSSSGGALPAAGARSINSVDLALSALGSYQSFQAFLAGVEKSARLLDVRDIMIKGSETGVYSYQMTLRLYWLQ